MTSHGAKVPGLVVDIRAYRQPDNTYLTYVPKVAFRDPSGKIRVMETRRGSIHYDFKREQPVMVLWRENSGTIAIDLPFQRRMATSVFMWVFTAIGVGAWIGGIWMITRRIYLTTTRVRELSENEQPQG